MSNYKKPLHRSITIGCISFILFLCIVLGVVNYITFYRALLARYNTYLTDLLNLIDYKIDKDDLYNCMLTNQKSEKYEEIQQLMNDILDSGSVHYLYIITPLEAEKTHTCLTLMTGMTKEEIEFHYDEQNFLGDVFDDFTVQTVKNFEAAMKKPGKIIFDIDSESTIWGMDYTGMLPLTTSNGKTFSVLAADVSVHDIYKILWIHTIENIIIISFIGILFSILFIIWSKYNITSPIEQLEHSVVDFARTSHNQTDPYQLIFNQPPIHTENEVEALSDAISQMTDDIKLYAKNIVEAKNKITDLQQNANELGMLAYRDSLTHVKNKAAYDKTVEILNEKIKNKNAEFAFVMIDLNSLKRINDIYGHEKGDLYITGSCSIICMIFDHSPVFRVGGDEFIVLLENTDFKFRDQLMAALKTSVEGYIKKTDCEPWEKYSMAAGIAVFNSNIDTDASTVFKRADKCMYNNKQLMKAMLTKETLDEL